jgi:tetratricopeptide (TPR) repeat protein
MSFFNFFRNDKKPPKAVERVFEKMKVDLEGRELSDKAISYRNLGEYDKALTLLKDAIEKYNYKPAITLIGTTALLKGDVDSAISWFEVNIKKPPKDARYLLIEWYANLGVIYLYKKEDFTTACTMFEKALNIPKSDELSNAKYEAMISPIHRDIAIAYLACGENTLAVDFAKKRLASDPNCEKSKKVISMSLARRNKTSLSPCLTSHPSCGTVIFSPEGKATQIASGGTVFSSPSQRVMHGMGHIILHMIYDASAKALPQYRDQIRKDISTIEVWAGVIDSNWTNDQEERFARQYEYYIAINKPALQLKLSKNEQLDKSISDILKRLSE